MHCLFRVVFWVLVLALFVYSGYRYHHASLEPDRDEKAFVLPEYYLFSNLRTCAQCTRYKLLLYREQFMHSKVHRDDQHADPASEAQEDRFFQSLKLPSNVLRARPELLRLDGWPVLFVHGHAGTYRQARALGAEAIRYKEHRPNAPTWSLFQQLEEMRAQPLASSFWGSRESLDVFAVDFDEAWSALTGREIESQASYIQYVTRYILSLYASRAKPERPAPNHVIIVSHSMGALATRLSLVATESPSAVLPQPVKIILSLATPHSSPLLSLEPGLSSIYERIALHEQTQPVERRPLVVSVLSGARDKVIPSSLSYIKDAGYNVLNVWATGIPYVWSSMGHDIIIWSHAFIRAVIETLHALSTAERRGQLSLDDRMAIFRSRFLPSSSPARPDAKRRPASISVSLKQHVAFPAVSPHFSRGRLELDALFGNASYALLALNETRQLSMLTNLKLGIHFLFLYGIRANKTTFHLPDAGFPFVIDTSYYLPYVLELQYPGISLFYNSIMTRIESMLSASQNDTTFLLLCKEACLVPVGKSISSPVLAEESAAAELSLSLLNILLPPSERLHAFEYEKPEIFTTYYSGRELSNAHRRRYGHPDHFLILSRPETEAQAVLEFSWIEWLWKGSEVVFPAGSTNGQVTIMMPAHLDSRIWAGCFCVIPDSKATSVMQPVLQHRSLMTNESKVWIGAGCTTLVSIPIPGVHRQPGTIRLYLDPHVSHRITWKADLPASLIWTFRHYWIYDFIIAPYSIFILLLALGLYKYYFGQGFSSPLSNLRALVHATPVVLFSIWACVYYAAGLGAFWGLDMSGFPAPLLVYYQSYLRGIVLVYLLICLCNAMVYCFARGMLLIMRSFWAVSFKPLYIVFAILSFFLSSHASFVLLYLGYLLEVIKAKCRLLSLAGNACQADADGRALATTENVYHRQLAVFHILSLLCCLKMALVISWIRDCARDFQFCFWLQEEGRFFDLAPFFVYLWLESSGPLDWALMMPRSPRTSTALKICLVSLLLLWSFGAFAYGASHVYRLHEWTKHMLVLLTALYLSFQRVSFLSKQ